MGPQLMTCFSLILPPRTLVVVYVHVDLKNSTEHTYKVKLNGFLMDKYPNIVIMHVIHIVPMWTDTPIPFIIIILSTKCTFLSKSEVLGFLDQTVVEICEIMTSSALEPLDLEVTAEQPKNPLLYRVGQFFCSSADIAVNRKVNLQDAEVRVFERNFKTFVSSILKFFSKNSENFGHTDLVTIDIETGDSSPISQKSYNLSLKHTTWVQKELEILEKVGITVQSVLPWACLTVAVPKQTKPIEPPMRRLCTDY